MRPQVVSPPNFFFSCALVGSHDSRNPLNTPLTALRQVGEGRVEHAVDVQQDRDVGHGKPADQSPGTTTARPRIMPSCSLR